MVTYFKRHEERRKSMIEIRMNDIPDNSVYAIICRHINVGFRLHLLFYLGYTFHIFEEDILRNESSIQKYIKYRQDKLPVELKTEQLPFLFKSLYNKIVDENTYLTPSKEDIILLNAVYELETKYIKSGMIPAKRVIPTEREYVIERYSEKYPDKTEEDIEKLLLKYEDIRYYTQLF